MSNTVWGGLFFCALSIWLLKHAIKELLNYEPSKRWPSTIGKIEDHENIQLLPGRHRDIFVEYKYEVSNKKYIGAKIALYTLSRKEAKELEEQYSIKPRVNVFYNPRDPSESLLIVGGRKDKPYSDLIMAIIGLLVGILILLGGYFGILIDT